MAERYIVKEQYANKEVYLPKLHQKVNPSELTQKQRIALVKLGLDFLFELELPKPKKKANDTHSEGTTE